MFLLIFSRYWQYQTHINITVEQGHEKNAFHLYKFAALNFYFTHRLDCLEKIHQHNADFSFAEPEDMYVASIIDNKGFTILKEIRDKDDPEGKRIINVAAKF